MFAWIQYIGGAFLGWSLGANDSANVFGTAVSSKMVSYRLAVILTAIFVIIGAVCQGRAGIETYSKKLTVQHATATSEIAPEASSKIKDSLVQKAALISFAAAITVTLMTILKIPVSTSQAAVGAIIGVGLMRNDANFSQLGKVIACWIGTPIGGALFTLIFYGIFSWIIRKWKPSIFVYDPMMSLLLIVTGCYGAYALGANNVANVSGVFVGDGMLTVGEAAFYGSIAIAIGALTYSKPVMSTVGKGIVKLDSFTAFICVLSHAVTVHIFAIIGVPVSTSQAIVGAILGISLIKGAHTVNYHMLGKVSVGWLATPFISGTIASLGYYITHLKYTP
ncbi:MAG: inorganic phosphate transporter family protein [Victivallaceae bacterium]|nr:inorganic phosphate transporter family protein [Victivallaceae bacterium]